jgi:hypothetical protein
MPSILAVAIFLSAQDAFLGLLSLVRIGGVALLFTFFPRLARHEKIQWILSRPEQRRQLTATWCLVTTPRTRSGMRGWPTASLSPSITAGLQPGDWRRRLSPVSVPSVPRLRCAPDILRAS